MDENGETVDTAVTRSDGQDAVIGTNPSIASDPVGSAAPAIGGTGIQTSEGEGRRNVDGSSERTAMWPEKEPLFLFWIPTRWLSVTSVHHRVDDSMPGRPTRSAFGDITTVPMVAETDAPVLAWVREQTARDLGLLDDDRFPGELRAAWRRPMTPPRAGSPQPRRTGTYGGRCADCSRSVTPHRRR